MSATPKRTEDTAPAPLEVRRLTVSYLSLIHI